MYINIVLITKTGDIILATKSVLKILGNELRRKILSLLSEEPNFITQIAKKLDVSQPAILRHLQILEDAGLVESYMQKNPLGAARKYYRICDSFELEIALHPEDFTVTRHSSRSECVKLKEMTKSIEGLTQEINLATDINDKASHAVELRGLVESLLTCEEFDEKYQECVNCHRVANLRKNVSTIILQISKGDINSGLKTLTDSIKQISGYPQKKR